MRQIGLLLYVTAFCSILVGCGPGSRSTDETGGGGGGGGGGGERQGGAGRNSRPSGTHTTVTGVVTAPNGIDPIPGALVYVPREIEEFPNEVSCEICGEILSNALVLTKTNADGTFSLGPLPTREDAQP